MRKTEQNASLSTARELMIEFADLTGLMPAREKGQRYLWTDAFAVCNFLELYRSFGDEIYKSLALRLVDQVHAVLGRHRDDDSRTGWISGLDQHEGIMHPTRGGLRIGKEMNERRPDEPYDERLEWERDGQYYHYLTKWMHALSRASSVTEDPTYNRWAIELAKTAHARFTYDHPASGRKRMYWKMSIDLSYPLVPSMGHHDPLDGLITYLQLQATAARDSDKSPGSDLGAEITDLAALCEGKQWTTDDPLGIGELLSSAYKLAQLTVPKGFEKDALLDTILHSSLTGIQSYARSNPLDLPAQERLPFRELGLSIGLHALERLQALIEHSAGCPTGNRRLHSQIDELTRSKPLGDMIEKYWLEPSNRQADTWQAHRAINMVMLATSLAPDGYLSP